MYLSGQCVCIVTCYMHTNVFIWTCEFVYINADHEYFLFFDRRWSTMVTNAIFTRVLTIGNVICRFDLYGHDCLSRIRARCQAQVERPCLVISTLTFDVHWDCVTYVRVTQLVQHWLRQCLVTCLAAGHCLNQGWPIINQTHENIFQLNAD